MLEGDDAIEAQDRPGRCRAALLLASIVRVEGARLDNGLLYIDIVRPRPEPYVRKVKISATKDGNIKESATKLDLDSR